MTVEQIFRKLLARALEVEAKRGPFPRNLEPAMSEYLNALVSKSQQPQTYSSPAQNRHLWREVLKQQKDYADIFKNMNVSDDDRKKLVKFFTTEELRNVKLKYKKNGSYEHAKDCGCQICLEKSKR